MVDPNFPDPSQEAEGIDDFLTPEDPHLKELLEKEHMEMQTADSPGAALAAVTSSEPTRPSNDQDPSSHDEQSRSDRSAEEQKNPNQQRGRPGSSHDDLQTTPLSNVPINLQIEVTRMPISLQQALDLKPGSILPINKDLEGDVDLVIGDKKIGTAQLVRIGDALGMRITQLS